MRLNTDEWKEFLISDLFEICLSKGDIKIEDVEKGNIPLISSGENNNGIIGFISEEGDGKATIFNAGNITVDMFGNSFYQGQKYYSVSHGRVNTLIPKFVINEQIGLFIATIINKEKYKYSYGRAVYSSVLEKMKISLPATPDGKQNFEYMEKYIKLLHSKPLTTSNVCVEKSRCSKFNVENWKEFKVADLFEIDTGGDIFPEQEEEGNIPVICLGFENNGVCMRIKANSKHPLYSAGCITIAGWAGGLKAFYQPEDFYVKGRLKIAIPKESLSKYVSIFICTMLNQEEYRYSYGRKASADKIPNTILILPATPDGKPDFEFMENYIKSLPYGDRI